MTMARLKETHLLLCFLLEKRQDTQRQQTKRDCNKKQAFMISWYLKSKIQNGSATSCQQKGNKAYLRKQKECYKNRRQTVKAIKRTNQKHREHTKMKTDKEWGKETGWNTQGLMNKWNTRIHRKRPGSGKSQQDKWRWILQNKTKKI